MLYYPKIPGSKHAPLERCIAFEKYDGTNLHWDWDRDFGWHAFGTRRDSFNLTEDGIAQFAERHVHLRECVPVFLQTLAEPLERIFRDHVDYRGEQSLQAFTEFFGPNSFAGLHQVDDPKQLRLFDVSAESIGMLGPGRFVADFGTLPIARVVYQGRLTGKFAEDVREGKYHVDEGVVCKGGEGGADLWMVKIKTYAYLQRLKQALADRWEDYWE
ncbi:RNA ligase family protein [Blastopirellula retiformator]|uniref:Uncharacterized protein n=1 Tax=Blastopirellula retiformator TaxID=2527970 RepID=A0A5C5VNG2_9BACT|nr:RNA ligase family protein [Blastopirellula retiformator]TWT39431.1 hypothetical protein Enr8_11300 [Blastopirellula retiformator]